MQRIVVLSGAGISAESGIRTFRDSDGLWENHRIEDVATPAAWVRNPALVLTFYRQRWEQLAQVAPNAAHKALVALESQYKVHIVTQNVDDLHERAGSTHVLHLHGELCFARSSLGRDKQLYPIRNRYIDLGDMAADGSQLRPHIVWFGEAVPNLEPAIELAATADHLLVVGTSLQVYPAASLVNYVSSGCGITVIDPHLSPTVLPPSTQLIAASATEGVPAWVEQMLG